MSPGTTAQRSTAVIGLQWGDEGKGKIVDLLAEQHDVVVRYNGGANAGHSVVVDGERFSLHLLPSGILRPGVHSVIANGVVIDPDQLLSELDSLRSRGIEPGPLAVSDRAHVVMPYHKAEDAVRETVLSEGGGGASLGTTGRGIGPAYAEKVQRGSAVRVGDLLRPEVLGRRIRTAIELKRPLFEAFAAHVSGEAWDVDTVVRQARSWGEQLAPHVADTRRLLQDAVASDRRVLFEGANATLLDIDHGTFPFVTSSSPSVHGIGTGTGLPPSAIESVIGISKAYQTRVGAGPMPTELRDATGDAIRERGREYGTTTGRPRRCGWLDLVALRYAAEINSVDTIALMLLDVLAGFDELKLCTSYRIDGVTTDVFVPDTSALEEARPVYTTLEGFSQDVTSSRLADDLPANALAYVSFVSDYVGVPISIVSVGPDRDQTIALGGEALR
ncbi:MAG: adenylosuccinate synthase [Planctomycetota bacterium]